MGRVLCRKHGLAGAEAVCTHVWARVCAGDDGPRFTCEVMFPVRVTCGGIDFGRTWLCTECLVDQKVPAEGVVIEDDGDYENEDYDDPLFRFYDAIDMSLVCPRCFEERCC